MLVRVMIAKSFFLYAGVPADYAHTNRLFNRTMVTYNRLLFTFLCQSQGVPSFLVYSEFFTFISFDV